MATGKVFGAAFSSGAFRVFSLAALVTLVAFSGGAPLASAAEPDTPSRAALEWLKKLAGTWHGKAEWSGERKGSYELGAIYSLTGNGTAVVENLVSNGVTTMTSVYHADGTDLRMTHYCGAGNQPRLKSTSIDPEKKTIHFKMTDMTGRPGPHVGESEVRVVDDDHATIFFTFVGGKTPSLERIDLTRESR
jgi:hypothetical protein